MTGLIHDPKVGDQRLPEGPEPWCINPMMEGGLPVGNGADAGAGVYM